jgi:cleavage and polyadenylation specificity factor subunit 2
LVKHIQYCSTSNICTRLAPTIDLVLLSHGDLQHSGLYAYAHAKWGLKCPAYTSLPVQAMARIAVTEDVEGVRDEQEVEDYENGDEDPSTNSDRRNSDDGMAEDHKPGLKRSRRRYLATAYEIHEAFDSINVLRYQQPCHLPGKVLGIVIDINSQ